MGKINMRSFKKLYLALLIIMGMSVDIFFNPSQFKSLQPSSLQDSTDSDLTKPIDCDFFDEAEKHENKQSNNKLDDRVSLKMIKVQAGCFLMGQQEDSGNEKPELACVSDYMLSQTEITQELWYEVMGNGSGDFKGCGKDFPMTQVSWNDIQLFIKRLNQQMHRNYRLPTEEEWEYACRSRGLTTTYCGEGDVDGIGWHVQNGSRMTYHRVAQKAPNKLGFYDMSGNVWEWTSSCDGDDCSQRIARGGSAFDEPFRLRASSYIVDRIMYPSRRGFRLAHDIKFE